MKKGSKQSEEAIEKMKISTKKSLYNGKNKAVGEKHHLWKKNEYSYRAIHYWVQRWKGKPRFCEKCGKIYTTARSVHWANIDHKYRRILDDYIAVCYKCHGEYDKKNNLRKHNK
jgi:hypothetical protein